MSEKLYLVADIGSTAVRLGIFKENGSLQYNHETSISYHIDPENEGYITQSSNQIWLAFLESLEFLTNALRTNEKVVSIGCYATVVMLKSDPPRFNADSLPSKFKKR